MTRMIAREQVGFVPLLAGNLLVVAPLAIALCAMFNSSEPLWLLQAPYFSLGAILVLALTPLEMWLLRRIHPHARGLFLEGFVAALASMLLGAPGAVLIFIAGVLVPSAGASHNLTGLWGYAIIGGFTVSLCAFICTLAGRLIAELIARFRPLAYVVFGGALLQLALTTTFVANRMT